MFGSSFFSPFRRRVAVKDRAFLQLEALETRELLAVLSVNAGQIVRPVNDNILGVNVAWWDTNLNTSQTQSMVQSAGLNIFRFPGGSSSDSFHFNDPPSYNGKGTVATFAQFIASVNGTGMATLDYGSGSPQEAAAFLAYLNAPLTNTMSIGYGEQWNTSTSTWVQKDWKTAGYWANLRAATPLTTDDGLNFLRLGRSSPFRTHYCDVGNEVYGSWEEDHHGTGGDTSQAHDPATYVAFAKQFAGYAAQIDPTTSIGVETSSDFSTWNTNVLEQGVTQGFTPGFLSDHQYMQAPGSENDSTLLLHTVSDPTTTHSWAWRAATYRNLLNQTLGAAAPGVELLATEYNSVYSNPGKQTTSLVNGLFVADSLGSILQTEYNGSLFWDLRNGWETGNNNSSSLYGWRQGGDYGLLGTSGTAPSTGTYAPYPTYFAEQLVSKMAHNGDSVVQASSDDPNLSMYVVREANGRLDLLVINKSATNDLTGQVQITGFQPGSQAQFWQYGKAQDTAQGQTSDGHSALANFTVTLNLSGSNFTYTFPSYSMTVIDLGPGQSGTVWVATPASASPSPVTGTMTTLSVLGGDSLGESRLNYTWATTGAPPAPVTFSGNSNGTNAAKSITANFATAGAYAFQVTITDTGNGLSTTSSVNVTVNQTPTQIVISPSAATVYTNATQQFTASAFDQFNHPVTTFTWAVTGGGSISAGGLFTAPAGAGTSIVTASSGGVSGSATVTVQLAAPAAPTNLSATVVQHNRVSLTWTDNANNENGYYVYTSLDGTNWTLVTTLRPISGTGSTGTYTTGKYAHGKRYFKVVAFNAAGTSTSNIVDVTL